MRKTVGLFDQVENQTKQKQKEHKAPNSENDKNTQPIEDPQYNEFDGAIKNDAEL